MKNDLIDFLLDNQKLYINSNTGKGKTLIMSILTLYLIDYLLENTEIKGFANYHLNIYNKKTNKRIFQYTKFGLLPFSELKKGNYIILIDDFIAVKSHIQNYSSILATLSRKLNVRFYTTIHYYTHLIPENRSLFHYEIIPKITHTTINGLTDKSKAKIDCYIPDTLRLDFSFYLYNLLEIVKGNFFLKNVYVKDFLYDTNEIVSFINEINLIDEILKWSRNIKDINQNINIISNKTSRQNQLIKEIKKRENINS